MNPSANNFFEWGNSTMAYEVTTENALRKLMGAPIHELVVVRSTL